MKISIFISRVAMGLFFLGLTSIASSQETACGSLKNHYGPFDYRTAPLHEKQRVEIPHFPPQVENLTGVSNSITQGGDISYTLGVFPNHPRALMSMMKLAEREKRDKPRDSAYSMACWFDRAERFRPDDAMVKVLHGIYLTRKGKKQEAMAKLDAALELGIPSPNIDYNIGLTYFDLGQFDKALQSAHRAYGAGYPLPGLRDKMKRAGKWKDSAPVLSAPETVTEVPVAKSELQ
jgi:tetratricopeptide (TPR) repeat protein